MRHRPQHETMNTAKGGNMERQENGNVHYHVIRRSSTGRRTTTSKPYRWWRGAFGLARTMMLRSGRAGYQYHERDGIEWCIYRDAHRTVTAEIIRCSEEHNG